MSLLPATQKLIRKVEELSGRLVHVEEVPDDPRADRVLIERWAKCLGLDGSFHFESHCLT